MHSNERCFVLKLPAVTSCISDQTFWPYIQKYLLPEKTGIQNKALDRFEGWMIQIQN